MGDEPGLRRYRGIPLLFAPGDGNQSDQEALVPLPARYRQSLELGEVVVLDGASYSGDNLRALEGFAWILRVPATLREARGLLGEEFPPAASPIGEHLEAWTPLPPGYRGLEVESEYGGVRQRWLLVESQERARLAETGGSGRRGGAKGLGQADGSNLGR